MARAYLVRTEPDRSKPRRIDSVTFPDEILEENGKNPGQALYDLIRRACSDYRTANGLEEHLTPAGFLNLPEEAKAAYGIHTEPVGTGFVIAMDAGFEITGGGVPDSLETTRETIGHDD